MKTKFLNKWSTVFFGLLFLMAVTISCSDNDEDITDEVTDEVADDSSDETVNDNLPDITGFPIVDTDQSTFFNNTTEISSPSSGADFYGQDAQYSGNQPSFTDNGDGTVTDNVTGLMWQSSFDHNDDGEIDVDDKLSLDEILVLPVTVTTGGHPDWRVPTIKEQYSLIMFSGRDICGYEGTDTDGLTPFINTDYFEYAYGDTDAGERLIDVQCASTNMYLPGTYGGTAETVFGVNFADGRIKGYGTTLFGQDKQFNYLLVRGNSTYGINEFTDNGDATITDNATGLMWTQEDNGEAIIWSDALSYAENAEEAGYTDWRLPNAKELQSIVDYSRSPDETNSAAIDALFACTEIINEAGETDYGFYWSGTTHANITEGSEGTFGAYVCFGRGMGYDPDWTDVHGAGAQRSDPKAGDPDDYPTGNGPQGDAVRIYNYVRLVRDIN
ncbi:MAG: DUF1566 domain-containing protein [Maribacter sp.]|uniref:Lcl C-terminal domain-containing protein n=1 Tax=Maribacter sp. TaxID=1897614 RepID=UPI003C75EB4A